MLLAYTQTELCLTATNMHVACVFHPIENCHRLPSSHTELRNQHEVTFHLFNLFCTIVNTYAKVFLWSQRTFYNSLIDKTTLKWFRNNHSSIATCFCEYLSVFCLGCCSDLKDLDDVFYMHKYIIYRYVFIYSITFLEI